MAKLPRLGCLIPGLVLGVVVCGFSFGSARDGVSRGDFIWALVIFGAVGFIYADISRKKGQ